MELLPATRLAPSAPKPFAPGTGRAPRPAPGAGGRSTGGGKARRMGWAVLHKPGPLPQPTLLMVAKSVLHLETPWFQSCWHLRWGIESIQGDLGGVKWISSIHSRGNRRDLDVKPNPLVP